MATRRTNSARREAKGEEDGWESRGEEAEPVVAGAKKSSTAASITAPQQAADLELPVPPPTAISSPATPRILSLPQATVMRAGFRASVDCTFLSADERWASRRDGTTCGAFRPKCPLQLSGADVFSNALLIPKKARHNRTSNIKQDFKKYHGFSNQCL